MAGADTTLVTSTDYELADLPHNFHVARILRLWNPRRNVSTGALSGHARRIVRGALHALAWIRLVLYLRKQKPDIVLFGEIRFAFERFFLGALRLSGLRLVDIVHDVEAFDVRRGSSKVLVDSRSHIEKFASIYKLFSALFVHSRSNRQRFVDLYGVPRDRVHTIEHATGELLLSIPQQYDEVHLKSKLALPADRPIVTFFGTITKYKGVEDLIRAFPTVLANNAAHLLVAGFPAKDVDVGDLKSLVADLLITDDVTLYLDYVPNEWVATLMRFSDVVVLPIGRSRRAAYSRSR